MFRILLAVAGSLGDVNPFIGIGKALRERGHEVILIANAAFEGRATAAGLGFAAAGSAADYENVTRNRALSKRSTAWEEGIREFLLPNIAPHFHSVMELYQPGRTILAGNGLSLGARIAQEKLGIPMATVLVWPTALRSVHEPPRYSPLPMKWLGKTGLKLLYRIADKEIDKRLAPETNAFRAKLDLPPARRLSDKWWLSPQRIIALWPEWYAPRQPDWPPQTELSGFPLFDADSSPLEHDLPGPGNRPSEAPILFTTGSATPPGPEFFSAAAEACQRLNRPGLFVTPHTSLVPKRLPPGVVHIEQYVPFSRLFPRTACVVHHGGISTASLAIAAGVPQIIMPMAHDHFDTASRIAKLGVGRIVYSSFFRPARLVRTIAQLLASERVTERCRFFQGCIQSETSIQRTCGLIEALGLPAQDVQ